MDAAVDSIVISNSIVDASSSHDMTIIAIQSFRTWRDMLCHENQDRTTRKERHDTR
jgi:hypothetical protein